MNIKKYIAKEVQRILNIEDEINITLPPKEDMGDYTVVCFQYRNEKLKSPKDVADYLKDNFNDEKNYIKEIKVSGPYLNFFLNFDVVSSKIIEQIEKEKDHYGSLNQGDKKELLIEHTSINPNASPHIGRARNSIIGNFLTHLYKFVGYDITRHYFVNDIGKQISMLLVGVKKYKDIDNVKFSEILDLYVKINEESKQNPEVEKEVFYYLNELENGNEEVRDQFKKLTDICIEGQKEIFEQLNIHWDVFTHESDFVFEHKVDEILDKLKEKGKLNEDENGRLYVDLSGYDIPTKSPVLVLTREDKTSLYPLRDIAYTIYKLEQNSENNFIVLGEDQEVYMKQISSVLDILGYKSPKLICYSFILLNGGKMATREGNVVLLEDLIKILHDSIEKEFQERNITTDEDTIMTLVDACIKYTILGISRNKIVNFNIDEATSFSGNSGVYILYNIVRINSILNKNEIKQTDIKYNHDIEHKILISLHEFPHEVNKLLETTEASHLVQYIFHLTKDFSKMYEEIHIQNEEDEILKNSRLRLINAIKITLTNALEILGIKTVDKM